MSLDSYDVAGVYEDCSPFSQDICCFYSYSDPDFSLQEDFFNDFISSPYRMMQEVYFADSSSEGELPYHWRDWGTEYDHCFDFNDSRGEAFFSCGYGIDNNRPTGGLEKLEDVFGSEEHKDTCGGYYENGESQLSGDYHCNSYESWWSGNGIEYDSDNNSRQQLKFANSYGLDELELCEGLFGYWPCLMKKHSKAYYVD